MLTYIHIHPAPHLSQSLVTLPPMNNVIPYKMWAGVVLLLALLGCHRENEAAPRSAQQAVPVITQRVQPQLWHDQLQSIGTVRAREAVSITAKVSELVEQVHFASGQHVEAGTLLVTLRQTAQQAALAQAQASLSEAQRLYQRQQTLAAQQLISPSTLDAQRAARDMAQARVQQLQAELADRQIRAPFSGQLGLRQISPGALLTANTVIATLDDLEQVYVDFQVPETALATLAVGNPIHASSIAWPGRQFVGTISSLDARVDSASRALTVRASFTNADHALRPGMLLEVAMLNTERSALAIPEIAVMQIGRQSFVYRVDKTDQVEQVEVRLGTRSNGQVEIAAGLESGDRIVIEGTQRLRPGMSITEANSNQDVL